ncbi:hypothetical protein CSUB01_11283, partial [Colletotrichum sublineola]
RLKATKATKATASSDTAERLRYATTGAQQHTPQAAYTKSFIFTMLTDFGTIDLLQVRVFDTEQMILRPAFCGHDLSSEKG